MPYINKNPSGLSKNEILSVIAFLQQMSGEPISVSPTELDLPRATPAPVKAADAGALAVAGLRTWVERHRFGSVTSEMFESLAERVADRPLADLFDGWLRQI